MGFGRAYGRARVAASAAGACGLALAACTAAKPLPPPTASAVPPIAAPPPAPPAPAPAERPELVFGFFKDGQHGRLFHGVPDTDDLDLTLDCRRGSEHVAISDLTHPEARPSDPLILGSGDAQSSVPAKIEPDDVSGGAIATAETSSRLPALLAFRKTGRITLTLGDHEAALSAKADAERAAIERFFAFCERRRSPAGSN